MYLQIKNFLTQKAVDKKELSTADYKMSLTFSENSAAQKEMPMIFAGDIL